MPRESLFRPYSIGDADRERLDRDGHLALPGILTDEACVRLTDSLSAIHAIQSPDPNRPRHYSAEHNAHLASLIAHPQMLELTRRVLGPDIRYDHCVALNRPGGDRGASWHSHEYADDRNDLGFIRIFFYVNGFAEDDGALGVVPGSHLFRDSKLTAASDEALREKWMAGKRHPLTGEPLEIEYLTAEPGTVIVMWTHAAHAVRPRKPGSDTRWTVVYAYRNPGAPSHARWVSEEFERNPPEGAEEIMGLY